MKSSDFYCMNPCRWISDYVAGATDMPNFMAIGPGVPASQIAEI